MIEKIHLAQVNVARMRAPLEDPLMVEFASQLEAINALADESPGFVWRLQTDEGDATALRPYDDDTILFNMSVWESAEALFEYTYKSGHIQLLARRKEWFTHYEGASLALWWVAAGHEPTIDEAKARLVLLREKGPTADAFTFGKRFGPGGEPESAPGGKSASASGK